MSEQTVPPETIDGSFVPRFRAAVVTVPVQKEAVLYEEDTGALHQLDPIGTIVCGMFDGRTPIEQLVGELAAAFEADPAVIATDVLSLVRDLGGKGLLDDVQGTTRVHEEGEDDGC